jgi:hypothetical protein
MPHDKAQSVSLAHFTTTVQSAVKAAVQKHPKFKLDPPQGVTFSYLVRGIPVPEALLANVTFGETQAFANEVAAQISAQPGIVAEAKLRPATGSIFSSGGHIIIGIPAVDQFQLER